MLTAITGKPTFASAMKTFTKAQEELQAAEDFNNAELEKAQKQVAECEAEGAKISKVKAFFDNLLG
jgi:Protein of unknown function (DUF964).